MDGPNCPVHLSKPMWLLSTWNKWVYYCEACDKRYNEKLEPKPDAAKT